MMHGTASRAYLRGDGYQAVLLPYRDINLAMAVLLPDGPLAALRPKLAAAGLGGLLAGAARHQVTLSLPRWLSVSVTVAAVVASYCLFTPVALTVRGAGVMLAVVVATESRM